MLYKLVIVSLLLKFSFNFCLLSQNNFIHFDKLSASSISPSKEKTAIANENGIYFIQNSDFQLLDSISIPKFQNKLVSDLFFLSEDMIGISYGTANRYNNEMVNPKFQFLEYPSDSIFIFNILTKEITIRIPGNYYIAPSIGSKTLIGYNDYFEYKDNYGDTKFGSKKGEIVFFEGDKRLQSNANGIVVSTSISPIEKQVALLYYFNDSMVIETRNSIDLSVISQQSFFGLGDEITYSDNGKYLVIKEFGIGNKELVSINYFKTENIQVLTKCPVDLTQKGVIENGTLWNLTDNSIVQTEISTEKKLTEIWANLTPFGSIDNYYKINEDEIIIIGTDNGQPEIWKKGVSKFSLKQNALYSNFSSTSKSIDTIQFFDPQHVTFQNNKIIEGSKKFDQKGSLMMINSETQIQLWDTKTRMKLYDFTFDATIKPFLSNDGSEILIFKKFDGKNFNDFYMQKLNLKDGKLISKLFEDNPYPFISPSDHYNYFFMTEDPNRAIYLERNSDFVWEIDLVSMNIETLFRFQKSEGLDYSLLERASIIPGTKNVLLDLERGKYLDNYANSKKSDPEQSGFYLLNTQAKWISKLNGLGETPNLFPVSETKCIAISKQSNDLFWYDLTTQKLTLFHKMEFASNDFEFQKNENFAYFICYEPKFSGNLNVGVIDLKSEKWVKSFTLKAQTLGGIRLFGNYFLLTSPSYSYDGFLMKSFNPNTEQYLSWNTKKIDGRFNQVQSDSSTLLTNYKNLIDLSDFSVHKNQMHLFKLLKHENVLLDTYYGTPYTNDVKNEFWVEAFSLNDLDTIKWVTNHIKYKELESTQPTELLVSSDENFVLFGFNPMLGYKDKICLVNVKMHELTMRDVPYKISSWGFFDNSTYWVIKASEGFTTDIKPEYFDIMTGKKINNLIIEERSKNIENPTVELQNVNFKNQSYYAREYLSQASYIHDKNRIIACGSKLHFWDVGNSTPIKQLQIGSSYIDQFEIQGHFLFAASRDGSIAVVDIDKMEQVMSITTIEKTDTTYLVAFTPEGYFKAPKEVMKDFHFVKNGKIFPLANYELFLNRPDKVLSALGFTPEKEIDLYKEAYLKRLKRNGLSETTDVFSLNRPEVSISNRSQISDFAKNEKLNIELSFSENTESYAIYGNGVLISSQNVSLQKKELNTIILNNGENNISVIARSKEGIESNPEFLTINYHDSIYQPKIHYIGVGVSNYADSVMNLKYADDDVRTLTQFLENKSYFKSNLLVDTLINQAATKENYLKLRDKLMLSNVNDIVIVSFSGHGLIDSNNDFYFATHDVNFKLPQQKGLSYNEIHSLLDEIPARKKLLLLDACHSGESDLETKHQWKVNTGELAKDGQKGGETENLDEKNTLEDYSFELMKSTFQDLDRGNGTFVISASGAKEYAIEKGGNGIFTMSFINAFKDWKWNNNGVLSITQLQKEIYKRVISATNGQQRPTSRSENIEWDWILE